MKTLSLSSDSSSAGFVKLSNREPSSPVHVVDGSKHNINSAPASSNNFIANEYGKPTFEIEVLTKLSDKMNN